MAVAVKHAPDAASQGLWSHLPVASLLGVVYVVASLAVVFSVVPSVWHAGIGSWLVPAAGPFLNGALLGLATLAVAVFLAIFGARLLGPRAPAGIRAGIFFGLLGVIVIGLLAKWASL